MQCFEHLCRHQSQRSWRVAQGLFGVEAAKMVTRRECRFLCDCPCILPGGGIPSDNLYFARPRMPSNVQVLAAGMIDTAGSSVTLAIA